jgi:hypothetical protein
MLIYEAHIPSPKVTSSPVHARVHYLIGFSSKIQVFAECGILAEISFNSRIGSSIRGMISLSNRTGAQGLMQLHCLVSTTNDGVFLAIIEMSNLEYQLHKLQRLIDHTLSAALDPNEIAHSLSTPKPILQYYDQLFLLERADISCSGQYRWNFLIFAIQEHIGSQLIQLRSEEVLSSSLTLSCGRTLFRNSLDIVSHVTAIQPIKREIVPGFFSLFFNHFDRKFFC